MWSKDDGLKTPETVTHSSFKLIRSDILSQQQKANSHSGPAAAH
jgi:hypothetical protein